MCAHEHICSRQIVGTIAHQQLQRIESDVTRTMDKVEEREVALRSAQEALLQIRGERGTVPVSERFEAISRLKEENAALRDVLDTFEVGVAVCSSICSDVRV
eukprot:7272149-Pyramimonas_sp.AAC.4